jgi:AraC family L-rhamnose operon transcriptional activator RhaR
MHWIQRLNSVPARLNAGAASAEVLHWAYSPHLSDNVPHRHTYFEICLVGEYGAGLFTVEGVPYRIGPGDLFIARPGVIHQIQNTDTPRMELYWVTFMWPVPAPTGRTSAPSELEAVLQAFAGAESLVVHGEQTQALWLALRSVASSPELPGKESQIQSVAGALLLAIAQAGASLPDAEPKLAAADLPARMAVRYIHDNLSRRLSVSEVADHVALSPRHFTRLFQEFTGATPADYIETARMHRALHLLRHSRRSVKEIATAAGYSDPHHFSRVFSRRFGLSPEQWRQSGQPVPGVTQPGELV